jgi:hypothetical protein
MGGPPSQASRRREFDHEIDGSSDEESNAGAAYEANFPRVGGRIAAGELAFGQTSATKPMIAGIATSINDMVMSFRPAWLETRM